MRNILLVLLIGFSGVSFAQKQAPESSGEDLSLEEEAAGDEIGGFEGSVEGPRREEPPKGNGEISADAEGEEDDGFFDFGEGEEPAGDEASAEESPEEEGQPRQSLPRRETVVKETPLSNQVTDLRFLAEQDGGTIVVETKSTPSYSTRKNEGNRQFIIELNDTGLPPKFTRPLITQNFPTAIGSVNAYQSLGSDKSVIVVQLKDDSAPEVKVEGRKLLITAKASQQSPQTRQGTINYNGGDGPGVEQPSLILQSQTLDEFLSTNQTYYGRKISLEVTRTPLRQVLEFIAEESGVNMIISPQIKGATSLKLRELPWDQIFVLVLKTNGLGYQRQGNVLRVAPIKELRAEATAAQQQEALKENSIPLMMKIVNVNYAKVDVLEKQVKEFLSKRGKVSGDKRTNSIVINDIPANVSKVEELIRSLDYPPPQVLIEGKIVEAQESFSKEMGVNWGFSGSPVDVGENVALTPTLDIAPAGTGTGASGLDFEVSIGTLDLFGDLAARLALAEREAKVKVVSSPRVITLTNEEALIHQTTEIPLVTTTVTGNNVTRGVTFKAVQLQLKVTPQVTSDNSVILEVDLTREFAGQVVEQDTQARPVNKRTAKTKVLVKNGHTAVLGGIYQSDSTESETGVPYLRKIPIFGTLFEASNKTRDKNELMIFLTPRVVARPISGSTN